MTNDTRIRFETIGKICDRTEAIIKQSTVINIQIERMSLFMDIDHATRQFKINPQSLLDLDHHNFTHDVFGIVSHMNRSNGLVEDCFVPRCADMTEEDIDAYPGNIAQAKLVAKSFTEALHRLLGADRMRQIVERNANESDQRVCHTHDFLDANMVMLEAFEAVMGFLYDLNDKQSEELFNLAWTHAKNMEFDSELMDETGSVKS